MFIIRCYILTALYFNPFSAKMKPLIKNRAVNSKRNSHAEFNFSAANQLILPERRFLITDLLSTVHAGCSKHRP